MRKILGTTSFYEYNLEFKEKVEVVFWKHEVLDRGEQWFNGDHKGDSINSWEVTDGIRSTIKNLLEEVRVAYQKPLV